MNKATLYTLHAEEITVQHGDTLPFQFMAHGSARRLGTDAWAVCLDAKVTTHHLPLHCARKATGFSPKHADREVVYEDQWYYMSPDVQQLLELPVKQKLEELKESNSRLTAERKLYRNLVTELEAGMVAWEDKLAAFAALPWYTRVYLAMKGKVCT